MPIIQDKTFQEWIKNNYQITTGNIIASDDEIDQELAAIEDEDFGENDE